MTELNINSLSPKKKRKVEEVFNMLREHAAVAHSVPMDRIRFSLHWESKGDWVRTYSQITCDGMGEFTLNAWRCPVCKKIFETPAFMCVEDGITCKHCKTKFILDEFNMLRKKK